ncbi:MAG TPA: hypothetical protein VFU02_11015 [Polyangiaceae bacterium]|nr:hypothetical protein [Polyangiaceae bacterium]
MPADPMRGRWFDRPRLVDCARTLASVIGATALAGCIVETGSPYYSEPQAARNAHHDLLARTWAPRFYQDVDDSYAVGDYIAKFNFDGDYNGKNNWENLSRFSTVPAHVYYAVSETETHYFIHYAVFHPRDWHEWIAAERHENDLEGVSLAIRKTGGAGTLVAMETMAHDQFYQYRAHPDVSHGTETIDGEVSVHDGTHPRVFIEAKGHGMFGCDARCDRAPGGNGIVYAYEGHAQSPQAGAGDFDEVYSYALIAFDADGRLGEDQGFWHRRHDICDTCSFGSWGKLRGDNYGSDRAKLAWAWDDPDDGTVSAGAMLCDPAQFFSAHLGGRAFDGRFSQRYLAHEYQTHLFELLAVQSSRGYDLWEGYADIYVQIVAPDSPAGPSELVGRSSWRMDEALTGVWYDVERARAAPFGPRHFCRPGHSPTTFAVYDLDSTTDDLLGSATLTDTVDHMDGVTLGEAEIRFSYDMR